jgi:hypothetical protein
LNHQYENIVVGSSFGAVLYAFVNNYPIFFTRPERPFKFDHLPAALDMSTLKVPAAAGKSLTTFEGEKEIGIPKEILWERLLFLLALDGKSPLSDLCRNIRYDGNSVTCSNQYAKILELKFGECHYFGDAGSMGFATEKQLDEHSYLCYDYIAFNKGGKHEIDYIHTDDDLVSEIWFYPSDRIDGNTPVRDACAVSTLTEEQLLDFDYSETMARFKVVHEMESRGMKGLLTNELTSAGNPKYYKFRTTSLARATCRTRADMRPESTEIKLPQINEEDLLARIPQACLGYDRFLRNL